MLARGGAAPVLLERHAQQHDALCGGFTSWRTLETLQTLGLETGKLGGHPISRVRLFAGHKRLEAALPDTGVGLSRARLDSALLRHAEQAGAAIERGVAVAAAETRTRVRLADGSTIDTDALFLATGKYELRGLKRSGSNDGDPWVGLRCRFRPSAKLHDAIDGFIELHFFSGGYAGLLLQEDASANLCMALRQSQLDAAGGKPKHFLRDLVRDVPSLEDRLSGENMGENNDAIARVPYGWRATTGQPGLFRLGDQAAVIPSLAGEGIGIAVASGGAAAEAYLQSGPQGAIAFQRRFAQRASRPVGTASIVKTLLENAAIAPSALQLARIPGLLTGLSRLTRIGGA